MSDITLHRAGRQRRHTQATSICIHEALENARGAQRWESEREQQRRRTTRSPRRPLGLVSPMPATVSIDRAAARWVTEPYAGRRGPSLLLCSVGWLQRAGDRQQQMETARCVGVGPPAPETWLAANGPCVAWLFSHERGCISKTNSRLGRPKWAGP